MILTGCNGNVKLDIANPTEIKIWHYYNGPQKIAFDNLISEFNETKGAETGIYVEAFNYGNIGELGGQIIDSANKEPGSEVLPELFLTYADLAYTVDQMGLLVDLDQYFTKKELESYIPAYIEEGRIGEDQSFKIMPIGKATEMMILNKTDWDKFAIATGADLKSLENIEGIVETSKNYYEWSDALTPDILDDGKAFFGRDSMANYLIIGNKQWGVDLFSVNDQGEVSFNIDEEAMKKCWDNYYVPSVKGYFSDSGRFRTDGAKVGDIIALVGSATTTVFFPDTVFMNDSESYLIDALALPVPGFKDGKPYAILQGGGIAVTKSTPEKEFAGTEFLKWFTEGERNTVFSKASMYLPVKKEANDKELKKLVGITENKPLLDEALMISLEAVNEKELYTTKAFENGNEARNVLENLLTEKLKEDRIAIQNLVNTGMRRQDATLLYTTDENFKSWLKSLKEALEATQSRE